MSESVSDAARWLQAVRTGSQEALGQLLEACRGYLLTIARQELGPDLQAKGGASDLVQETFFEAVRDFDRFSGSSEEELLAWLRRLLLNNLANFVRHYRDTDKRQVSREVSWDGPGSSVSLGEQHAGAHTSASGVAMAREQDQALQQALARLPDNYRQVLTLRYQEDRTFEEIGRSLRCTAKTARKLWMEAVERLEREMSGPT